METVLAKLEAARQVRPQGWVARCPAHEDHNPSLSLSTGADAKVLLKCFAGCTTEAVVEAMGLQMTDLFEHEEVRAQPAQRTVRDWSIRDGLGEVVAIHQRIDISGENKRYTWSTPDGRLGLGGIPVSNLPLYGSEHLREWRRDQAVILVEGEKAADALLAAGRHALGTVTGAHSTPSEDVLAWLDGREVYLWPDNDDVGRNHMRRIAAALEGVAKGVRWIEIPVASPHADAADYLGLANDQKAALRALTSFVGPVPELAEDGRPAAEGSADELAWEAVPLPRALTDLPPPLGGDALVGLVGQVAGATVDLVGCDPLSAVLQLLAMWGAICPPNLREPFLRQPAREYALVVGRTSRSRKGTTYDSLMRLIAAADPTIRQRDVHWQGGSGEGLLAKLGKSDENGRPVDPRGLIYADEFGMVMAQARRTGQTFLPVLRSLWNTDGSADIATRGNPVRVSGLHLAAILHTTPEEVQEGFRAGDISSGMVNRFLVARLRPAELRATTTDYSSSIFDELTSKLADSVARLQWRSEEAIRVVPATADAETLWLSAKAEMDAQAAGPVGGDVLARGAGHVARLALLYALIDGRDAVDEVDLRGAFALWSACRSSALLLFGSMTGDRDADRIFSVLAAHGGEMTRTELRDALGRHGRGDDVEYALVMLATRGLIERSRRQSGGRPIERLRITSALSDPGDISDRSDIRVARPVLSSLMSHLSPGSPPRKVPDLPSEAARIFAEDLVQPATLEGAV